jgi:endonuclease G
MDWLKIIQIAALICIGVLIFEVSLWFTFQQDKSWLLPATAVITYLSILSTLFLGKESEWIKSTTAFLYRLLLSTWKRALVVLVISAVASVFLGTSLWNVRSKQAVEREVREQEPNYFVELYKGSRAYPVQSASVTLFDLMSKSLETKNTDKDGLASFKVQNGRLWQVLVVLDRGGNLSETKLAVDNNVVLPFVKAVDLDNIRPGEWSSLGPVTTATPSSSDIGFAALKSESTTEIKPQPNSSPERYGNINFRGTHLPWGEPNAGIVIYHEGYILGYESLWRTPRWAAYQIKMGPLGQRPDYIFSADPLIPTTIQATVSDYAGSGYDKGGLISHVDMGGYGEQAQTEAYYASTTVPQTPESNRKPWFKIERYARSLASNNKIWIIAGPAFVPAEGSTVVNYPQIGKNKVAVPTHFFRIIIKVDNSSIPQAIAFLVPNNSNVTDNIAEYLTSIDKIELLTGLSFFSDLDAHEQRRLKSFVPTTLW